MDMTLNGKNLILNLVPIISMPSYDVYSGDSSVLATKINSTQTTGITIAAMNINGTLTGWANTAGVIEVSEQSDSTLKREWIYYTGTSVNATTKVATLSGVVRGITSTSSDVTSGGTGVAFSKGAIVRFVTFHDLLNKKANLDRAGTITATWTFGTSGKIAFSSTSTEGFVNQGLTTAQRDAVASWTNGAQIYNTSLGQTQWREGGAWVTNAVGSTVADASTTVAGKAEEAILSEVSAGTPIGGTGARLFINPSLVKKTSSGAAEGNVVALNATPAVDVSIGGTGVVNPTSGSLYVGAGSSPMTEVAPSTSGNVLKSNGSTWTSGTVPESEKCVAIAYGDSSTLGASSTADFNFDPVISGSATIPANDLINGVEYEFEAAISLSLAAGSIELSAKLGSTKVITYGDIVPAASGTIILKGRLTGTAAAGASVAVKGAGTYDSVLTGNTHTGLANYYSTSVATNGSLLFQICGAFRTSNGGNNMILKSYRLTRRASTAS